jgi:hypothetical protein
MDKLDKEVEGGIAMIEQRYSKLTATMVTEKLAQLIKQTNEKN